MVGGAGGTHLPEAFAPFGAVSLHTARPCSSAGVALDYSSLLDKNLAPQHFTAYFPINFD